MMLLALLVMMGLFVLIITVAVVVVLLKRNSSARDSSEYTPDITSLIYSRSGSSDGALYSIELRGSKMEVTKCPGMGEKTKVKKYKVYSDLYETLNQLIDTYAVRNWVNLAKSDVFAMDAASVFLAISFADGQQITVKNDDILPEGCGKGYREIINALENYIK